MHAQILESAGQPGPSPLSFQLQLTAFNRKRLAPKPNAVHWERELRAATEMQILECRFVEQERQRARAIAASAPSDADAFVRWFEGLKENGPGQGHPLFNWLAETASLPQMTWFLEQEVAGEAGFDDLVALSQVKLPPRAKLEMARNYWDEMGQGSLSAMHGPLLSRLAGELKLDGTRAPIWETLALGNLMVALAMHRHYAYHSIGALGVIELTAPGRAQLVNFGLKRLGVCGSARRYYALHATLDVRHSLDWNREVLHPLVAADPSVAQALAEGALMRLFAGERCFLSYCSELGVSFTQ